MKPSTLKRLEGLVIKTTTKYPETCNNDKLLTLYVWQEQGAKIPEDLITYLANERFFKPESISRAWRGMRPKVKEKSLL